MAAIHNGRLTLDAVLRIEKRQPVTAHVNRTLLDILLDDDPHGSASDHEDKKTWEAFRDRLRLNRPGSAESTRDWTGPSEGTRSLAEERAVRVSLMDLLEETIPEENKEEEEEEGSNGGRVVVVEQEHATCCCVCMVRHKGAAFIPCGHTFCRLCSKELLAKRGHCPLCNASILEILHIF